MKKQIKFEYWVCPLGSNIEDVDLPDKTKFVPPSSISNFMDLEDEPEPWNIQGMMAKHPIPLYVGSMGIVPLTEHNSPSKTFNFWMGHTNFDLTIKEVTKIEKIPGVESLDVFTRYRFRVGIGKMFKAAEVMSSIESALCDETNELNTEVELNEQLPKDILDKLIVLMKSLHREYKYCAAFVLPNGQIDYIGTNDIDNETFIKQFNTYKETRKLIGGALFTSWD